MISEGRRVSYAGEDPMNDVGSAGRVVAISGLAAHVSWDSGPRRGAIDLIDLNDLIEQRSAPHHQSASAPYRNPHAQVSESFDAALDMPATPVLSVRATLDEQGEDGLISALNEAGRIAVVAEYADEALALVSARVRQDASFTEVLAQLDPDEADSLVARVASTVLLDRVTEEG